ncbi:MAG TPA: pyridoxamine 5'-phosphate oxidase family protein [Nocardioidaceae bacterium]|nr:pyridoxamine 5'-phosphate oxidase family protein [Nocardioidaceae bacterium]
MAEVRELTSVECERLLRGGVVGRIAVSTPTGPHIVPVNYSVVDDAIIFRTSPYSVLGTYGRDAQLAFEVDHFNYAEHRGWSVVAHGRGEPVTESAEIQQIRDEWPPRPWADGARNLYFRVRWTELSGRRLGTGGILDDEMPVQRLVGAP